MLPNTIDCTFTAVPQSSGMPSILLYAMALLPFHDLNTPPIEPQSCSSAESGNSTPSTSFTLSLNCSQSAFSSSAVISVSDLYPLAFLRSSIILSSCWRIPCPSSGSIPSAFSITTSEYIMIRRRYASYTKRGLPVFSISPGMVLEQRPILRMVSIIPGIELLAPERQLTRRGSLLSPNFLPMMDSVAFRASATSSLSSSVYPPPS